MQKVCPGSSCRRYVWGHIVRTAGSKPVNLTGLIVGIVGSKPAYLTNLPGFTWNDPNQLLLDEACVIFNELFNEL